MAVPTSAPTSQNAPQLEDTPTPIVDTPAPEPPFCTTGRAFDSTALPASSHLVRVLFLNDDLWLWRQETGTADPISTGGHVTAYLNAPDNSAVAYIKNGNLWLWREGQAVIQLSENGSANNLRFSPDSSLIAYSRALGDDQYEIWAINSDGGPARLLATASAAETWERNPDAEKSDDVFQPRATFTLWRINTSEGTATLFNTFSGFVLEVVLAPDKQHFAFWKEKQGGLRDLHIVNLTTGQDEVYDSGRYSLIFDHWLSDSIHFVYSYQTVGNSQTCFLLGQIGQSPMVFPPEIRPPTPTVKWVDETTFILDQDSRYDGFINSGTLYWHSLHGERMLISDYVRPTTGEPPDASFIAYFAEP
jgi:hypothetical protein